MMGDVKVKDEQPSDVKVKDEQPSDVANANGDAPKRKTDTWSNEQKDDGYSIKIKPEFILSSRPSCLPDLPSAPPESSSSNGNNSKSRRKKTGMNKKRPRDTRIPDDEKMCNAVLRGESCSFANCKYNHDLKKALSDRPSDIKEVEGGCPHWNNQGYCIYGITCRLGSCHLNMSDGSNLKQEIEGGPSPSTKNVLDKDIRQQLMKRRYPFVCKSFREKQKLSKQEMKRETSSPDDLDLSSPLPSKPRKLIDFRNKVYIAPLTTVGNLPFRRICKRFGADITCGEMALAQNLLQGQNSEWALLKRHPEEDVFGVQIAAGYPEMYTRIAEVLEAHTEVDFVDCNLGCPIDLICDKYGAGAKMMLRDNRLKTSLEGMTNVLSCPVTVKIRTGWDENKPIAEALVKKIQGWGIKGIGAIMIHGRSRLQRYQKLANWDYIHTVAAAQSSSDEDHPVIPIIGNGDIFSYTDYHDKISLNSSSNANEHGDDSSDDPTTTTTSTSALSPTAMLGRGALIKPWLPTEIKEQRHWDISSSERMDMLKQFVKFGLEHWGSDQKGVNTTRRFLLEWLSFLYRYVPVGLLEVLPQQMNMRPPQHMCGRDDLETLMLSKHCADWIKISEMLLGPVPDDFQFQPKHKANGY